MKKIKRENKVRKFHQASWDEPIIFELSRATTFFNPIVLSFRIILLTELKV